jgi:hypothetical protein
MKSYKCESSKLLQDTIINIVNNDFLILSYDFRAS